MVTYLFQSQEQSIIFVMNKILFTPHNFDTSLLLKIDSTIKMTKQFYCQCDLVSRKQGSEGVGTEKLRKNLNKSEKFEIIRYLKLALEDYL